MELEIFKKRLASFSSNLLLKEIQFIFSSLKKNGYIDSFYNFSLYNIYPISDNFLKIVNNLNSYDYICFTSRNSVFIFFNFLNEYSINFLKHIKYVFFGEKTYKEFTHFKRKEKYVLINSHDFEKIDLLKYFKEESIYQKKTLHVKGDKALNDFKKWLNLYKIQVKDCILYKNTSASLSKNIYIEYKKLNPNYLFFTSFTSIDYFLNSQFNKITKLESTILISIGKKTTEYIKKKMKFKEIIELKKNDVDELKNLFK